MSLTKEHQKTKNHLDDRKLELGDVVVIRQPSLIGLFQNKNVEEANINTFSSLEKRPNIDYHKVFNEEKVNKNPSMPKEYALVYEVTADAVQVIPLVPVKKRDGFVPLRITVEDLKEGSLAEEFLLSLDQMTLIRKDAVIEKCAQVGVKKLDDILRRMAQRIVEKHYDVVHKKNGNFVAGQTPIPYAGRVYDAQEMKCLVDSAFDFWLTAGRFAKQFEKDFASFLGVRHSILTNSGSSANLLAMSALTSPKLEERTIHPGDEVLTAACAFPTTVNPIVQNRLIPVFVDVDLGTYNVSKEKIEAALSPKTKAIFLAHTLGNPFDLKAVMAAARKHNLWVIEDNCDALGAEYEGKHTGTFGHISTFSFYPHHHMTMGEGGAVATNDPLLKTIIESFRDWGRDCWCDPGKDNTCGKRFAWQLGSLPYGYDHKYTFFHLGYNLKITDMQAAVGVAQLKKLPGFVAARRRNWKALFEGLKAYEDYFILPRATEGSHPSWFGFLLTVKDTAPFTKNELVQYLEERKITTRQLFCGNIIRHPSFQNVEYRVCGDLKNTDLIMNNTLWVGVYPGLTDQMIDYMIDTFKAFMKQYKNGLG